MPDESTRRLLVVANLTESAPRLLEEVERRAHRLRREVWAARA